MVSLWGFSSCWVTLYKTFTLTQVKQKLARNAAARRQTGGGELQEEELDDIEELYAQTVNSFLDHIFGHLLAVWTMLPTQLYHNRFCQSCNKCYQSKYPQLAPDAYVGATADQDFVLAEKEGDETVAVVGDEAAPEDEEMAAVAGPSGNAARAVAGSSEATSPPPPSLQIPPTRQPFRVRIVLQGSSGFL